MNMCYNELNCARRRKNVPITNKDILAIYDDYSEYNLNYIIKNLKDKYRVVFELFYIDDVKISEISKILHISEATVKTRLKRARQEIKKHIM